MKSVYKTNVQNSYFGRKVKKLTLSDIINIIGIAISSFLAGVGIWLSVQLSSQKQSIDGFETLLSDNKAVIKKLSDQLDILNKQLALNEQASRDELVATKRKELSNASKLYSSATGIQLLTLRLLEWHNAKLTEIWSEDRDTYIAQSRALLLEGLNNEIILSNPILYTKWQTVLAEINTYQHLDQMKRVFEQYDDQTKKDFLQRNPTAAKEHLRVEKLWSQIPLKLTNVASYTVTFVQQNYTGFIKK